nr:hypothetical protein [uncultured Hyphomonas sp.]
MLTHGVDLRYWEAAAELRKSLRTEGFELIDVHAELASVLCDGAFTAREYLDESDARAYFRLRYAVTPDTALLANYPNRLNEILTKRLHSMPPEEEGRQYYGVLEAQKIQELALIPASDSELLVRNSDVRAYLRKVGERNGFRHLSKRVPPMPSILVKEMPNTGITGFFGVDSGGKGAIVKFGLPLPPLVNFHLCTDAQYLDSMWLKPWDIITAMHVYSLMRGAINPRMGPRDSRTGQRPIDTVPPEFWSDIIKLGVVAYVRFFDLFLESVDASAVHLRPN